MELGPVWDVSIGAQGIYSRCEEIFIFLGFFETALHRARESGGVTKFLIRNLDGPDSPLSWHSIHLMDLLFLDRNFYFSDEYVVTNEGVC